MKDKILYYYEGDKIVFTEQYHIKRGTCCGNMCRHCAFFPKYQKGNKNQRDSQKD